MGNSGCKPWEGDTKWMEQRHPGSTKRLCKWQSKYGFDGTLNVESCTTLVNKLHLEDKVKKRKKKRKGLIDAEKNGWKQHLEGMDKSKG